MHIYVKTLTGKTNQISINSNSSISELNNEINSTFGVPAEEQKLIFNGQKLSSGLVSNYGLTEESCVYLIVDIEGGKKKKKKKAKKPKRQHKKKKVNLAVLKYFKVEGGKVVRLRQRSEVGTFMAEHADRYYCGKSHITFKKREDTKGGDKKTADAGKGKKK